MPAFVRLLASEDAEAFRRVRLDALERFPSAFLTTAAEFRERSDASLAEGLGRGKSWGVFSEEVLIGIAALLPFPYAAAAHRAEIGAFYVIPEHQGSGAAAALLQAMVDRAAELGIWQLELFVAEDNPRAERFYRRRGFTEAGRLPNAALVNGKMTSDIFMVRDLRR
ncbi:MAG: GNAT family N-acetyltransferase [Pseudomonadota bacterium]